MTNVFFGFGAIANCNVVICGEKEEIIEDGGI